MITLENLKDKWSVDCQIDKILLDDTTLQVPVRHSRWLDIHHDCKRQLRKLESLKKQFPPTERRGNSDYLNLLESIEDTKQCISYSEECISFINKLGFHVNNILKFRIWSQGSSEGLNI